MPDYYGALGQCGGSAPRELSQESVVEKISFELPLNIEYILGFLAALVAVYLLTRPLKWLWKWVVNGIFGVVILYLLHCLGPIWGVVVPLNFLSIAVAALLGLPGVALILLRLLFFS